MPTAARAIAFVLKHPGGETNSQWRNEPMVKRLLPLALALAACLALGCGAGKVRLELDPATQKIEVIEFNTSFVSKGCAALERRADGTLRLLVQQAGSSNWITGHVLGDLGDIAGAMPILGGGGQQHGEPTRGDVIGTTDGCEGLFPAIKSPAKSPPEVEAEAAADHGHDVGPAQPAD